MRSLWNFFFNKYDTYDKSAGIRWGRVVLVSYLLGAFISFGYITANYPAYTENYCSKRTIVTIRYDGVDVPDKKENTDPACSEKEIDTPSTVFKGLFGAFGWPLYISYKVQKDGVL